MRRFLDQNPRFRDHAGADCSKLGPAVGELAKASTQNELDAWSMKYVGEPRVAQAIGTLTLPGSYPPLLKQTSTVRAVRTLAPLRPPEALLQEARKFLDAWIARGDIAGSVEFISVDEIKKQFGTDDPAVQSRAALTAWSKKMLTMYLVDDHAAINGAGHGDPRNKGYAELPESPPRQGMYRASVSFAPPALVVQDFFPVALAGLVSTPAAVGIGPGSTAGFRSGGEPGGRAAGGGGAGRGAAAAGQAAAGNPDAFMLAVQFPHQPYDALAVVWQQLSGRWVIVRLVGAIV